MTRKEKVLELNEKISEINSKLISALSVSSISESTILTLQERKAQIEKQLEELALNVAFTGDEYQ